MTVDSDMGPFAIVPEWVLRIPNISAGAVRLFAELALMADRESGESWPSRKTLADRLEVASLRTIDGYLEELNAAGAVRKDPRFDGEGGRRSSLYHVQFVAPGRAARTLPPHAAARSQNQNHKEPESRTRETKTPARGMTENQILADTLLDEHSTAQYLISRLDDSWQEALTPARLMKLGMEFSGSVVLDALRDLRESEPDADDHYAYLRGVCQSLKVSA